MLFLCLLVTNLTMMWDGCTGNTVWGCELGHYGSGGGGGFLISCAVVIILIWILLRERVSYLNYTGWCQRHLTVEATWWPSSVQGHVQYSLPRRLVGLLYLVMRHVLGSMVEFLWVVKLTLVRLLVIVLYGRMPRKIIRRIRLLRQWIELFLIVILLLLSLCVTLDMCHPGLRLVIIEFLLVQ